LIARPTAAHAQGFNLNRFEPAERGSSWFVLDSLDIRGHVRPAAGLTVDYQYQPLALKKNDETVAAIVGHVVTMDVGGSVVFWDRVRIGASLPVLFYNEGDTTHLHHQPVYAPQDHQGIGDLRVGGDFRIYGRTDGLFTFALGGSTWIPTGSPTSYTSDGTLRGGPHASIVGKLGRFVYAANTGVVFRSPKTATFDGSPIDTDWVFGAAAGATFVEERLTVGPELFGSTGVGDHAFKTRTTPVEALLGAHVGLPKDLRAGLGIGKGIAAGYGSPDIRLLGMIEWAPGLPPPPPGPPPPPDTDGDGIIDAEDACPDSFGKRMSDAKTNGCDDRDKDGIPDPLDACPTIVGVASADPKKNGCPADQDGDGFPDNVDACPTVPGLASEDPKRNGCPDSDRDKDGIPNETDACPDEVGPSHPDPKKNGCPVAAVHGTQITIKQEITFKPDSAQIDESKETVDVLTAIRDILAVHSEIAKVRVEGHTDNRGKPAANKKLSEERAAAVVTWLVNNGIEQSRLTSAGFGQERPLEPNDTEEGRAVNRRVEFHIEESAPAPEPAKP
jgi:outer membrane protein OmpA-like peptidoglycan-associated protein